jgi:hypothetical protein
VPRCRARGAEERSAQFAESSLSAAENSLSCCVLQRVGPKKFTEPVALLSTTPGNLRLPPTALRSRFDLLALRARCKSNLPREPTSRQDLPARKARILRTGNCPHFHGLCAGLGRSLWIVSPIHGQDHLVQNLPNPEGRGWPKASPPGSDPERAPNPPPCRHIVRRARGFVRVSLRQGCWPHRTPSGSDPGAGALGDVREGPRSQCRVWLGPRSGGMEALDCSLDCSNSGRQAVARLLRQLSITLTLVHSWNR